MPVIDPSELIGCTFLMDKEDGQQHCARLLNVIDEEFTYFTSNACH
jgi:hypothetical protein